MFRDGDDGVVGGCLNCTGDDVGVEGPWNDASLLLILSGQRRNGYRFPCSYKEGRKEDPDSRSLRLAT